MRRACHARHAAVAADPFGRVLPGDDASHVVEPYFCRVVG